MRSAVHKVTSKGQVTIPIDILREVDLKAGDRVVFSRRGRQIIVESAEDIVKSLYGVFSSHATEHDRNSDIQDLIDREHEALEQAIIEDVLAELED